MKLKINKMKRIVLLLLVFASCSDSIDTNKLTTCEYYKDNGSQMEIVGEFAGNYNLEFEEDEIITDLSKCDYPLNEADKTELKIKNKGSEVIIHTRTKGKRSVLILK